MQLAEGLGVTTGPGGEACGLADDVDTSTTVDGLRVLVGKLRVNVDQAGDHDKVPTDLRVVLAQVRRRPPRASRSSSLNETSSGSAGL